MGTIVGLTLSGLIVDSLGWEAVFYIEGPVALIFLLMWMTLVYDSPEQHPRISDKEKAYIARAMGKTGNNQKVSRSQSRIQSNSLSRRILCRNSNRKCQYRGNPSPLPFLSGLYWSPTVR